MKGKNHILGTALLVLIAMILAGCGVLTRQQSRQSGEELSAAENGERIYFTGVDRNGDRIPYSGGPNFGGMMMGSYLTCAACHGPQAQGGEHMMMMQIMSAPPINGEALNEMMLEESEGTDPTSEYSLDSFRAAVVEGKHPDGDILNTQMPRWQINDQDLADLLLFLNTLPK
jgi:cytochrome c oxidase subunit 2